MNITYNLNSSIIDTVTNIPIYTWTYFSYEFNPQIPLEFIGTEAELQEYLHTTYGNS